MIVNYKNGNDIIKIKLSKEDEELMGAEMNRGFLFGPITNEEMTKFYIAALNDQSDSQLKELTEGLKFALKVIEKGEHKGDIFLTSEAALELCFDRSVENMTLMKDACHHILDNGRSELDVYQVWHEILEGHGSLQSALQSILLTRISK